MKVLAVTIKVKKDKVEVAESFLRSFLEPSRSEKGCIQYDLFQSTEDRQIFYFFEKWKDDQAIEEHGSQPFLKEFHDRFDELLEEPNQILWLSPVD